MFLHIGGDVVLPMRNIIAIMDIESTTVSKDTKEFLKIAEEEGFIEINNERLLTFPHKLYSMIDNKYINLF